MIPNQQKMKKALFLNYELAGYYIACLEQLVKNHQAEVHIIRYPVNPVAPFKIVIDNPGIKLYERKSYSDEQLIKLTAEINPDFIFCNGWGDKGYIGICKLKKQRLYTIHANQKLIISNTFKFFSVKKVKFYASKK